MIADHLFFTCINILLGWSVYVTLLTGNLSFAQGAFMAVGCYASGWLTVKAGMPMLPATLVAALIASLIAGLIGYPALRLRGIYLILATLGLTFCIRVLLENLKFLGGIGGFGGMTGGDLPKAAMAVALIGALLWMVSRSPLQRMLDAVREDDRVAASLGINVTAIRLLGFSAGAAIAAVAGMLYGHYMSFVRPENFDVMLSIYAVLYIVLGGVNNVWGAVLGAAIMTLLPEYIRFMADWRPTVFGACVLALLLFRPPGLLSFRSVTARAAHGSPVRGG